MLIVEIESIIIITRKSLEIFNKYTSTLNMYSFVNGVFTHYTFFTLNIVFVRSGLQLIHIVLGLATSC